jgi:hypothetical protein
MRLLADGFGEPRDCGTIESQRTYGQGVLVIVFLTSPDPALYSDYSTFLSTSAFLPRRR